MEIAVRREPRFVIVDVVGEIDVNAVTRIRDTLGDLTKAASPQIVVNLARAIYIDSSGLGALMAARRDALKRGGRLALCGMTKDVRMVFELTRLNKFFEIYDDE
ncbi:MAG: STAS domain-containing protein, partial [Candidatus Rokubacteria bacterium]|nr:STAS domain-containing protein [Candidatus Rokubacteria bacterium]